DTRNQFYGGQFGLKLGWYFDRASIEMIGKIALGNAHRVVEVGGVTQLSDGSSFSGGLLSQPSNIGRQSNDQFTVIPDRQIRLGFELLPNIHIGIGYEFLYWNRVVRPGNQIDPNVNATQRFGGTLVGEARPEPLFNPVDFLAHGANFTIEFKY